MAAERSSGENLLAEAIGLRDVLFQAVTHMAPGAAVAFSIVVGAGFAGGALPLAVVVAVIGCGFTAVSLGQLSKHLPTAGSFYTYTSRALHPSIGFLTGWAYALAEATVLPLCMLLVGIVVAGTFAAEFGWSVDLWWPWALAGSAVVLALGYFGIKVSARTGTILGAFEVLVFLGLGIWLVVRAGDQNTFSVFTAEHATVEGFTGFSGIFAASVYAILAFIGFEAAAPLAEEAKNPRRTIGLAAVLSAVGVGLFYVFVTYGAAVFFGPERMAGFQAFNAGNPYEGLARQVWGAGWVLVFLALVNSSLACSNAGANATTRTWYAMGRIRLLPRSLGRVHPRYRSPHVAVIWQSALSVAVLLWLGFQYDPLTAFAILGTLLTLVAVAIYIMINVSCFAYYLRYRRDEFRVGTHVIVPLLGTVLFVPAILTAGGIRAFKFVAALPTPLSYAGPALLIWVLAGIVYLAYLYARAPDRLADTKKVYLEEEVVEALDAP